ncbi:Pentatricopeptide repeat-containing, chloroplastic -like protein [Gossypium arboreum]|uniref:Pentatricopeptide repeat-containing, chloroplastic-like protein n=1 Tax=Gossypium arboreum TaxID=29729 RepID=A0A0B0NJ95_GOSAR|nr:Pentatricopeptide repeat-containing, chloroplastic -like protein [Gossypium arboreum]
MLRSGYLPHVKAWSAVVSRLSTEPPSESINRFDSVTRRVRRFADPSIVADSNPDTFAYNAVLNASANLGDKRIKPDMYTLYGGWRITTFERNIGSGASGLLDGKKGQVLMAAKEDVGSLLDRRLLDLSIGKVDILALSTDERLLANMEPRCSIPLPQAGFIKDIVWRKAAKYNFLVLTKDGKLFHGKFPDPSLTELMDGIDAVESSDIGDIVVAKQNNITVFSSDLNEKMIIPLSSELWLGVPMGGATNVGEPVDNYSDCKIKVDAIKWIVLNDDNTFSDCIVVGGYKYNEDGREEDYLLLVLKSKMGRILNPTSQLVAYSKFEFYWNLSGPFCIGPPGMGPYLIFNSFRNG